MNQFSKKFTMPYEHVIEIIVPPKTSNVERGRVLERLASRFLNTQNYRVSEEVRLTATEVDLLGTEKTTGEKIFVECKAHRSTIAAEVLQKLLGNVTFRNYSAGWLISTFALGKDAKGFEEEWSLRPPAERRKIQIYPPSRLIERLVSARIVVDAESLQVDRNRYTPGKEAYLLLTQDCEFWAIPILDRDSGIQSGALLFRGDTGKRIVDSATLDLISSSDTTLNLPWLTDSNESQKTASHRLHEELQSIVRVPVADHWADYRPARPEDFVGREELQSDVFGFFEAVRSGRTQTRLLALKGPSGWGKSSTVLKIASKASNVRNRGKYFVFTIDSRAATTGRFPELAIATAIKAAIEKGFIKSNGDLEFSGTANLFLGSAMRELATALKQEGKVLCVFFDQFEELLYKSELAEVFNQMRGICAAVEEAQTNLVIGFSWKTDGVIPTEHNAYHMWHNLSDRRLELSMTPFSEREVSLAINRFAKELGHPLIPQLRRVLQDNCQGFPWLLKKLCVHILELSRNGIEQADILNKSINIQDLFSTDVENLAPSEHACLKQIALESPAEFFKICQNFGDEVVTRLVDKRLVIRSGTRLTIYWDIFRDYILTDKIPYIPVTYVPQANIGRYAVALIFMLGKPHLSYLELGEHMGLSMGAADNLVRDLANLGHVDASRKDAKIVPKFSTEHQAIEIAVTYWEAHEVVRRLHEGGTNDGALSEKEFERIYSLANKRTELDKRTVALYSTRVLGWLRGLGIVAQIGNTLIVQEPSQRTPISLGGVVATRLKKSDFFLGEAPPAKVVGAFRAICKGTITRSDLESSYGRNACNVLVKFGLMRPDASRLTNTTDTSAEAKVAACAFAAPAVRVAAEFLAEKGSVPGLEFGKHLGERFGAVWSQGSQRRYGTALRQWAEWTARLGK